MTASHHPTRRDALRLVAVPVLAAAFPAWGAEDLGAADWRNYVNRFVGADGRVIDTGNNGISHSESMGYGLILAAAAKDRTVFDRMWTWIRANLLIRPDGLVAWKWEPGKGVTDTNNATDGDLLIALGLLRGAEAWRDPDLRKAALALAQAIRKALVVEVGDLTVLMAGANGFRRANSIVTNPSYFVLPALQALAQADPAAAWDAVVRCGLVVLAKARIGHWQLPPDWIELDTDGNVSLANGFKAQFGYDAIRVPLYLAWGGYRDPYYFRPYAVLASSFPNGIPATVGLPGGGTGQARASTGMMAVHGLAAKLAQVGTEITVPPLAPDEDYYSTTLFLLSGMAERTLGLTR